MHVLAIIIFFGTLGCDQSFDIDKERQVLQTLTADFYKALENGDFETTKRFLADDWELFIQTNRLSREAWLQMFEQYFTPAGKVKITVNSSAWGVSPTMAWYKADESFDFGLQKEVWKRHFLSTYIWEKRNSRWQVVHAHHSIISESRTARTQ
jgi:ketosteroid isomerase-like protein